MFRTTVFDDPLENVPVAAMPRFLGAALDYEAHTILDWHLHDVAQLVYARSGTMQLTSVDSVFFASTNNGLVGPLGYSTPG